MLHNFEVGIEDHQLGGRLLRDDELQQTQLEEATVVTIQNPYHEISIGIDGKCSVVLARESPLGRSD